ncbi:MAG TPA: PEGA domain-containing protein [Vicinamibacterales bacterium]|nr:PEGA domain-containing protein [Vicinamibacterales bacterium]
MTQLAAGEAPDLRPSKPAKPPAPPDAPAAEGDAARVEGYGAVASRVQPSDAEVLIDGERWQGATEKALVVQLAAGTHSIEVRKDGYRSYTAQVGVRGKETSSINVSLSKGDGR